MASEFKHLFTPIQIGPVTIRNRIFSPPYATSMLEDEACGWWDRVAHFHAERAKGGIGLIVMSEVSAHPVAVAHRFTTLDERHIPHLRKLTELIHGHGAKIFQLIHNPGRHALPAYSHRPTWGPSPTRRGAMTITHAMDHDEIKEMVASYGRTAKIIKEAGFDGIELQGAHGFMIGSFLSPAPNMRSDEYGGSLENRMRLLNQILAAVREQIDGDIALGTSLSIDELNPRGITVEEGQEIAARLDSGGMLNYLTARVGDFAAVPIWIGDMRVAPGAGVPFAAVVKRVVKMPVLTVLRIKDPFHAERILAEGQADMVGMGRATLCDPELPRKAESGRSEEIRYCISCNQGCLQRYEQGLTIECVLNPAVGLERQLGIGKIPPAQRKKRVLVVGGGPAGLKTAEMAASRGHQVVLFERGPELGGQILIACRLPGREEVAESTSHLASEIRRLGVEIHLNTEASAETVAESHPDAVVIATGSAPVAVPYKANDRVKVFHALDIIQRKVEAGNAVVVFDGGESHWKCCGTAELLAQAGKKVTLVTMRSFAGWDLPPNTVPPFYQRMAEHEATIIPFTVVTRVTPEGVAVRDLFSRRERVIEADSLVYAGDNEVCDGLYRELKGKVPELYAIGDCVSPRKVDAAIREGFLTALKL
jgi:2,4-dienoyl-CoA reductase-like NADH-dependent reductase (Old Yellow Enzyme family)/thioredoxin reductase